MSYYRLVLKEQKKDCLIVNHYDLKDFDIRRLWNSEKMESWDNDFKLYYDKKGLKLDYMPNVLSWLIFSDKVVNILEKLDTKGIQVIPVQLLNKNNQKEILRYNIINVLRLIPAMNWEKSDYAVWEDNPKEVKFIRKLAINQCSIPEDTDIFNLEEAVPYYIVSDKIKTAFEKENITGAEFVKCELA